MITIFFSNGNRHYNLNVYLNGMPQSLIIVCGIQHAGTPNFGTFNGVEHFHSEHF